ncbi:phosphodiester glycosidase family protein [Actinomadura sp. 9N407]
MLTLLASALPASTATAVPAHADPLDIDRRTRRVGPGTTLTSFDRLSPKGWLRADLLTVDLTAGVRAGYLSPGTVASTEPLSRQAERAGAIAAVNGDFFDIGRTGAPNGAAVDDGRLIKSARPGWPTGTAGIGRDGLGQVAQIFLDGEVVLPRGRRIRLDQLNTHTVRGIGAYTPLWGTRPRANGTEVLVVDGKVSSISDEPGSGPIPANGFVLLENGGDLLRALKPGDPVGLRYRPRSSGRKPAFAIGGRQVLLENGRIPPLPDPVRHPRTAVGFTADRRRMILMTVDGRQADSRGVTLAGLAALMKEAGAHDALNLDGGGSSTLLGREPGRSRPRVENQPSGGRERAVPNGIGLFAKGSGRLTGFSVKTSSTRVFPGLTRRLIARGHDETLGPAKGVPRWISGPRGRIDRNGTFHAREPGPVTVTAVKGKAVKGKARGQAELTVLGRLARVALTRRNGAYKVVGFDREGYSAPIEPSDTRLTCDPSDPSLVTAEVQGKKTTTQPPPDPVIIQEGTAQDSTLENRGLRFAVVSGASRHALREVVAARPDFLIVNGDFASTGRTADLAAAKRALDEELGGRVPYHYLPGDQEIRGPGTIENFRRIFGRPWRTFDREGTRFILLDSSTTTYRAGSFRQLHMLRNALDGARRDPSVRSVIVVGHHSRLSDPKESALLKRWLSKFRATGKGTAVLNAHSPAFHASRLDGVRTFTSGTNGWAMFGVSPARTPRWLRAKVNITPRGTRSG